MITERAGAGCAHCSGVVTRLDADDRAIDFGTRRAVTDRHNIIRVNRLPEPHLHAPAVEPVITEAVDQGVRHKSENGHSRHQRTFEIQCASDAVVVHGVTAVSGIVVGSYLPFPIYHCLYHA
jgi:hypothetical protein